MWSGPAVVAMPKNAILSTVARRVRPRVRGRRLFCFEIRNGKNGIRWFGVSADGRTVEANGTAHSTAAASFVRLFPMQLSSQPANQPFISGKKSRFLLTTEAPCALCAACLPAGSASQPKTRNERSRSSMGEIGVFKWAERRRRSCRFFVPPSLPPSLPPRLLRLRLPTPFSLDWKGASER